MISQTAEYALRAILQLGSDADRPQTTREIAEATQVPVPYLSKVLQALARAGLVVSQRGLHGGFTLARRPDRLTVYEVVQAVDPLPRIRECPLKLEAHRDSLCPLHRRLDEAVEMVERSFRASTIAQLLSQPGPGEPARHCATCEPFVGAKDGAAIAR